MDRAVQNIVKRVVLALCVVAWACCPARSARSCSAVRFAAGQSSATIHGMAPASGVICYSVATGAGQQATLKIVQGQNTVFTIDGLVDAQDSFDFKTQKKSYHILVGQLMRSATPEAFALSVAVK